MNSALERKRQGHDNDYKFEVNVVCTESSNPGLPRILRPCLKNPKNHNQTHNKEDVSLSSLQTNLRQDTKQRGID